MFNYAALLLAIASPLVLATPVPAPDFSLDKFTSHSDYSNYTTLDDIPHSLSARDLAEDMGPKFNGGMFVDFTYCVPSTDTSQCILSIFDSDKSPSPKVWLFDYNCNVMGSNTAVPRGELASDNGFALGSSLPWYVVLKYTLAGAKNGGEGVSWMYAGSYTDPRWEVQKWMDGVSRIWSVSWNDDNWRLSRLGWSCR